MVTVCPSTNPCPEDKLVAYAKELQQMNVEFLHCDVMDGEFVENKCLPASLIKEISNNTIINLDIHLMVSNPLQKLKEYIDINANYITVHFEAFNNKKEIIKAIDIIHARGILAGISIKPTTPVSAITSLLPLVDLVLVMSVQPGASGQKFIPTSIEKIRKLKNIAHKNKLLFKIEVDGGINEDNAQLVINAGANMLVMGTAFYNSSNRKQLLNNIQNKTKLQG